jgi:hypothetical protein
MVFIADSMNVIPVSTDYPERDKSQGPLQPRRLGQVDSEPVTPALIAAGHLHWLGQAVSGGNDHRPRPIRRGPRAGNCRRIGAGVQPRAGQGAVDAGIMQLLILPNIFWVNLI